MHHFILFISSRHFRLFYLIIKMIRNKKNMKKDVSDETQAVWNFIWPIVECNDTPHPRGTPAAAAVSAYKININKSVWPQVGPEHRLWGPDTRDVPIKHARRPLLEKGAINYNLSWLSAKTEPRLNNLSVIVWICHGMDLLSPYNYSLVENDTWNVVVGNIAKLNSPASLNHATRAMTE